MVTSTSNKMNTARSRKQEPGVPVIPTDEQMRSKGMTSLSSRIRHLDALGLPVGEIRKIVKRENGEHPLYQHVRNVLRQPLKQPMAEASTTEGTSDKE